MNGPSFRSHIEALSHALREKYELKIENARDDSNEFVTLVNDFVAIKFFAGWPRDPYVDVSISYVKQNLPEKTKSFELWRFIDYVDGWHFFPVTWPSGKNDLAPDRNSDYSFVGSPFQILETLSFLAAFAEHLLGQEFDWLREFSEWLDQKDRDYNEQMTKPKS